MSRILEERGLISVLQAANKGKAVGECQVCKLSRAAQEQLRCEMQVAAEEGEEPAESHLDVVQESLRTDCCMQKMLANQQDFKEEKPLIQTIIEKAGHKCWFLPKFHCELNPIEMYWGWTKAHECSLQQSGDNAATSCVTDQLHIECRLPHCGRWHMSHHKTTHSRNSR